MKNLKIENFQRKNLLNIIKTKLENISQGPK